MQFIFVSSALFVVNAYTEMLFPIKAGKLFKIGYYPRQPSSLYTELKMQTYFLSSYTRLEQAIADFQSGRLCTVVVVPPNLEIHRKAGRQIVISLIYDRTNIFSLMCRNYVLGLLDRFNRRLIIERAKKIDDRIIEMQFSEDPDFKSLVALYFLLIPFIFVFSAVIVSNLAIDIFNSDIERKMCEIMLTIVNPIEIIIGRILALLVSGLIHFIFWVIIFDFRGVLMPRKIRIIIYSLSLCFLLLSIGIFLITYFKERKKSITLFSNIIIISVPLLIYISHHRIINILSPLYIIPSLIFTENQVYLIPTSIFIVAGVVLSFLAAKNYENIFETDHRLI